MALNTRAKNSSRLIPITTSGVTMGSRIRVSAAAAPERDRSLARPRPRSVPRIVVVTTAIAATWKLTLSPRIRFLSPNSSGYHLSVKPRHANTSFASLKLKMIRITIGANRNT